LEPERYFLEIKNEKSYLLFSKNVSLVIFFLPYDSFGLDMDSDSAKCLDADPDSVNLNSKKRFEGS
jgi:hypothetical protein